MKTDPRVDAYIAKSNALAKPILEYLRATIHEAVPDVDETIKWSMPFFEHRGQLCNIGGFKAHCAMHFWHGREQSFDRIESMKDLPPKRELIRIIREFAKRNEQGIKTVRPKRAPKPKLETPPALAAALKKNKKANAAFEKFPPSHQREYIEWIAGAKADETRQRRLKQAIEWMAEGKWRNWKYGR